MASTRSQSDWLKRMGADAAAGVPKYKPKVVVGASVQLVLALPLIYLATLITVEGMVYLGLIGLIALCFLSFTQLLGLISALYELASPFKLYMWIQVYIIPVIELSGIGLMGYNIYLCTTPTGSDYFFCMAGKDIPSYLLAARFVVALLMTLLVWSPVRNLSNYLAIAASENECA